MINKINSINKINRITSIQSKSFFLKYLHDKGYISKENTLSIKPKDSSNNKIESINLKELLDEKNIKLTLRDIITDYKYFKHRYYKRDDKDYLYEYTQIKKEKEFIFPFTRDNISLKKMYKYFIFQGENKTRVYNVLFYALVFSCLNIILFSKLKYKEIKNYEKTKRIMEKVNLEDSIE